MWRGSRDGGVGGGILRGNVGADCREARHRFPREDYRRAVRGVDMRHGPGARGTGVHGADGSGAWIGDDSGVVQRGGMADLLKASAASRRFWAVDKLILGYLAFSSILLAGWWSAIPDGRAGGGARGRRGAAADRNQGAEPDQSVLSLLVSLAIRGGLPQGDGAAQYRPSATAAPTGGWRGWISAFRAQWDVCRLRCTFEYTFECCICTVIFPGWYNLNTTEPGTYFYRYGHL